MFKNAVVLSVGKDKTSYYCICFEVIDENSNSIQDMSDKYLTIETKDIIGIYKNKINLKERF